MMVPDTFNAASYFVDRHTAEGRGGDVAIECGTERVTYGQLAERVNRVGNALRDQLQVRIEERVVILLSDGPEFIYAFFGALKIGAVPIPVNTLWKAADYEYVLNDSRARVLIVGEALRPQIDVIARARPRYLRHVVVVDRDFDALVAAASPDLEAEPTSKDDAAFWLYSSGSTGFPKGCVHLHHDMVTCAEAYAKGVLGITASDRCFSVAKLFFAYGLGNSMYFPFSVGGTTILWPGPSTAGNVYSIIEARRPTMFFSVPTNFGMLLAHRREGADFDLSSLRIVVSAGEALPAALFERFKQRFGVEILDGIGSTEVLHIFISNRPGAVRPGSSGRLVPGYDARLVDEHNEAVPTGQIGNLLIRGDSTCAAYWNRHEKSKDAIEGHWIRTGDKYVRDEDGYFWYAGRSDDMLKVGGVWVSPVEVENVLVEYHGIMECGVVGRPDHDGLIKPAAYVVLEPDVEGTPELASALQEWVSTRLAPYKRPRWIEFVPELPKTATGKIQRFKLRERGAVVV
ncbi:MAG TPA: benzoate-CoA ligase family protein [Vicinamibacterales bacterium]